MNNKEQLNKLISLFHIARDISISTLYHINAHIFVSDNSFHMHSLSIPYTYVL